MAISINKVPEEVRKNIIEDYLSNLSLRQLELKYNVTRATISKYLEEKQIKQSKGNHYRKYFHMENFFEDIDNEKKAYWLGFMFADGYIINKENRYGQDAFGITLAEDSLDTLEKFKKDIEASNPINWDNSKKGQRQCKINLTSQKTVNDLIDKGCFKQKSLILEPPKKVPENLIPHFIRGFFDGDGSIIKYERTETSTIFQINITSTYKMVKWIKDYIGMGQIIPEKRREQTWYFTLGGNRQVIKFYHLLYENATVWMDRKYNRFQELLNKYSES